MARIHAEAKRDLEAHRRRAIHCPKCRANVSNYQTGEGPVFCPWCDSKIAMGLNAAERRDNAVQRRDQKGRA